MAKRAKTDIADVGLRLREALRSQIERAAKRHGVSMNAEIVARLEDSFRVDDQLGGPEMRDIAALMISSFRSAGAAADTADGVGSPDEYGWLRDRFCYLHAATAVVENLMVAVPHGPLTPEEIEEEIGYLAQALKERLISQWTRRSKAAGTKTTERPEEKGEKNV